MTTGRALRIDRIDITIVKDYGAMCRLAAQMVISRIRSFPKMNLLVPTGSTPAGVYAILGKEHGEDFKLAVFFNMDEYCIPVEGQMRLLPETHPASYRYYMEQHFFHRVKRAQKHFPGIENIEEEGSYDRLILDSGGIDLCLNAMGEDGHTFGFNLPGTSFHSRTRLVQLNDETRGVNQKLTGLQTPEHAITVGLLTGMDSREILFLVSGQRKAAILHKVLHAREPDPLIPATLLKRHPHCHWIVDEAAAAQLK